MPMAGPHDANDEGLEALGQTPVMPKRFSLLSLLSLGFAITATWNGFGAAIGASIAMTSSAGTLWTLTVAAMMNLIVSIGMAELASAYPSSGAQYYWSFRVASSEWAPFASYISACVNTCGWWLGLASVCNFVAAMILAILRLCMDDYVIQVSHQRFVYVAVLLLAVVMNVHGIRYLPAFNRFVLYFSLSALVFTIATILTCAAPNLRSTLWVFTDTSSQDRTNGKTFLFVLSLVNNAYGLMGTDAGAHLSEEIPSPRVNVPKVIVYPIAIGYLTALPFAVACMYVMTDIPKVVNPPSGFALIEIYHQATGSIALTAFLLGAFAFCLFGCAVANITSSSRQIWAASRDNCFPGSSLWAEIDPDSQMPRNAAWLSGFVTAIYGLIFLGSQTAFNSMVNAAIIFMMTSYVIPQAILLWRSREISLPERPFDLGSWRPYVSVTSCLWVGFLDIAACVPTVRPISVANMNWVSVVVFVTFAYMLIAWYRWQRHVFGGPRLDVHAIGLEASRSSADWPRTEGLSKDVKGE